MAKKSAIDKIVDELRSQIDTLLAHKAADLASYDTKIETLCATIDTLNATRRKPTAQKVRSIVDVALTPMDRKTASAGS